MDQAESHRVPRPWRPERSLPRGAGPSTTRVSCPTTSSGPPTDGLNLRRDTVTPFHRRGARQREIRPLPKVPRPSAAEAAPGPLCGLQGAQALPLSRQPGANREQAGEAPPPPRPRPRAPNYKGPRPSGGSRIPGAPGARQVQNVHGPKTRSARAAATMCGECGSRLPPSAGLSPAAAAGPHAPTLRRLGLRARRQGPGSGLAWRWGVDESWPLVDVPG